MNLLDRIRHAVFGRGIPVPCAFPPPYKAMLAINSDVEWTRWPVQLGLFQELANRNLETAGSFWCFSSPEVTWRLFNDDLSSTPHTEAGYGLIRAGLLDTIHSFGGRKHVNGSSFDRDSMRFAYEQLNNSGARPKIYSNHGGTFDTQNVAAEGWASYQEGDLPESSAYHLDLTLKAGVRYFWTDLDYVIEPTSLLAEIDTAQGLFVSETGRDGNSYLRFRRYLGSLSMSCSLDNVHDQINQILDKMAPGYSVIYQHLGVERKPDGKPDEARWPLKPFVLEAFDRLATAQEAGEILVTTTARLLDHAALMTAKPWKIFPMEGGYEVRFDHRLNLPGLSTELDWPDLEGWCLPIRQGERVTLQLRDEQRQADTFRIGSRHYAGFRWQKLDMQKAIDEANQITGTPLKTLEISTPQIV